MLTEKEEQRYLQEHPELGNLAEEFEQTDGQTPLPEGIKEEMLRAVLAKTQRRKVVRMSAALSAAAAVLLMVGVGLLLKSGREKSSPTIYARTVTRIEWLTRSNDGTQQETLTLPDGSTAILYPSSKIQYRKDFGPDNRDIRVSGEAFFEVVKNPKTPFVAYADGIRTVVLGTAFKVINDSAVDRIRVQLFTGKVRVTAPGSINELQPGQEFIWERNDKRSWVSNFDRKNGRTKLLDGKTGTLANWYMFNDQNLATVFDQLSAIYGADIEYSDGSIQNMYFLGRLDRRDSLDKILLDLALLNHLTVTHRGNKYHISKIK
jgi:ferric-dicitrate binding protein FerR (iron transport regulator)